MSTLTDFLLTRIAEDEATALAGRNADVIWPLRGALGVVTTGEDLYLAVTPDRVLAECEAKRRIIAAWPDPFGQWTAVQADAARAQKDPTLRALALPYATHPDYRDEWRP